MQEQTDPTGDSSTPSTAVTDTQAEAGEAVASVPDDTAFRGLQPSIEQVPYHTPPAQGEAEAVVAPAVKQAGPIVPDSEPAPVEQVSQRRSSRQPVIVVAAVTAVCLCVVVALEFSHRL